MAFLGLLIVASLFAADVDDLHAVGAVYDPSQGIFYDCATFSLSGTPTGEQKAEARQKCIDTKWCVWNLGSNTCQRDECLKVLGDTTADQTACEIISFAGFNCQAKYLTDGWNCTDYSAIRTDRFCRVSTLAATFDRELIDACFYTDLKSIAQDWTGPRLCTGATCSNKTSSAGGYCAVTGQDCSLFDKNSNEYCNCLGPTNCDLYPGCFKNSSSSCVFDICTDPAVVSISTPVDEYSHCSFVGGGAATNCKIRPQWFFSPGATSATKQWFCVDRSKSHANECYYAVKSTLVHPTIPGCGPGVGVIPCDACDTYTYDESVCTNNPIIAPDSGAGIDTNPPSTVFEYSTDTNCTLVDIAEKYVGPTAGKYCTDGDRTVPSPSAGNLVRIPSVVAFALALVAAFFL